MWSDTDTGEIEKTRNTTFCRWEKKKLYATFREWSKGQTTYVTQENFFFLSFFGKNDVRALCSTTVRLWSEMSKFCSTNVLRPAAALLLGRRPNLRIIQNSYLHRRNFCVSLLRIMVWFSVMATTGLFAYLCLLCVTLTTRIIIINDTVHNILGDFNMDGFYDGLVVLNITAPGWVSIKLRYNVWKIEVHIYRNT